MAETTHHGAEAATATAVHPFVHAVPFKVLAGVFAALLVLTVVTVAATWVDLGRFNLWIAMAIATVKATLVVLYFMHMRYDRPVNAIVFVTALLFLALFVSIALIDTRAYQPEMIPGYAPAMER
ncbi:MAG: cytochrome C oxidase subunit IV family protein [Acidobacteria bacterium]|nr:cytochrome C oxidase subunit IV family protein [Acidobacteriota bacterium]